MDKEYLRELYIFGDPIETELGEVRFLSLKEYIKNIQNLSVMNMNVLHIYYELRKNIKKKDKEALGELEQIKEMGLRDIVVQMEFLREAYISIFKLVFEDEDIIGDIFSNERYFNTYRELILDMQIMVEDEVSPNPEIQKGIERGMKAKRHTGEKQTSTDIISSIVAGTSNSFEEVGNMTLFQAYIVFYRLGTLKDYDTRTLFSTVSSDVKIESWSRNINLFENISETSLKRSDFEQNAKGIFK